MFVILLRLSSCQTVPGFSEGLTGTIKIKKPWTETPGQPSYPITWAANSPTSHHAESVFNSLGDRSKTRTASWPPLPVLLHQVDVVPARFCLSRHPRVLFQRSGNLLKRSAVRVLKWPAKASGSFQALADRLHGSPLCPPVTAHHRLSIRLFPYYLFHGGAWKTEKKKKGIKIFWTHGATRGSH